MCSDVCARAFVCVYLRSCGYMRAGRVGRASEGYTVGCILRACERVRDRVFVGWHCEGPAQVAADFDDAAGLIDPSLSFFILAPASE